MAHNTDIATEINAVRGNGLMFGMVRAYRRNKILCDLLNERRDYADEEAFAGKRLIIETDGRRLDVELRLNELSFLNAQNIAYAVINDRKQGLCILMDRYEKDGQAECHPFSDGKVSVETCYKNKQQIITFSIEDDG